jgi:phosphatidylglycerophosphate synthase
LRRAQWIPWSLTTLRLLMAPLVLSALYGRLPRFIFVVCLIVAFVTDIYDGKIARRLGVTTPAMRRYDSLTDLAFYLSILWSAWILYPDVVRRFAWGIGAVLLLDAACHLTSFVRFGKPASTHCYSAKAWGILLFAAFAALLGFGMAGWLLWTTIIFGCVAEIESLIILLAANRWPSDVSSVFDAWRLYRTPVDPL